MKQIFQRLILPLSLALLASAVFADHTEQNSALQDAWLDGKLGAIVVLNEHLNPFVIDTDVVDGNAIISGKVNSSIQKSLMSELALSVDGIDSVDNRLLMAVQESHDRSVEEIDAVSTMLDASNTTAVSTKLLLEQDIDSSAIDVDTAQQTVVLSGTVESSIDRELVEKIAVNTFEGDSVINKLEVLN